MHPQIKTEVYNDIWIRGEVVRKGSRLSEERYSAVKSVLSNYKRKFTLLDIGANCGYFGIRSAYDFGCVSVMVEAAESCGEVVRANNIPGTMYLHRRLSIKDLKDLRECEHFDVVLALNIIHHMSDWKAAAEHILDLGDNVIIETPAKDDKGACNYNHIPHIHSWLSTKPHYELGSFKSHVSNTRRPMWLFENKRTGLTAPFIGFPLDKREPGWLTINSDFNKKEVIKGTDPVRDWIPGINLVTFWKLNGMHPNRNHVVNMVRKFKTDRPHGDIRPWNFIFDGVSLNLIDFFGHNIYDDDTAPMECANILLNNDWPVDPRKVK